MTKSKPRDEDKLLEEKLTHKMQQEKDRFIKKHKISKTQSDDIAGEMRGVAPGQDTVVSIKRKRSDSGDGDDLKALEQKIKAKQGMKTSNKRQKTK